MWRRNSINRKSGRKAGEFFVVWVDPYTERQGFTRGGGNDKDLFLFYLNILIAQFIFRENHA